MEKEKYIFRGSFNSIKAELTKRLFLFIIALITFIWLNTLLRYTTNEYQITNVFEEIMNFNTDKILGIIKLLGINILSFFTIIIMIFAVIKVLFLIYDFSNTFTVDLSENKIYNKSLSFPFTQIYEEHKFNEIVGVTIVRGIFDTILNCGDIYIEYKTYSSKDSSPTINGLLVQRVNNPAEIKKILLG